jgi:hypothetical protein
MKRLANGLLFVIAGACGVAPLKAQTTIFSDNMGGSFSSNWTSAGTGTASFSSGVLLLDNNGLSGQTYAYTSAFSSAYQTTLSSNSGAVTWSFNMRTLTTDPSNTNRLAFVLGASSNNFTTASGYAVRVGTNSPGTDPLDLVYFTGGVNGTVTSIASGASLTSNQYASVSVTYAPSTNTWSLYGSSGSSWSDPTLVSTFLGSGVNSTGTSTSLGYMGPWSLHTTAAGQDRTFDNVSLTAVPEPSFYAAIMGAAILMVTALRHRQRAA